MLAIRYNEPSGVVRLTALEVPHLFLPCSRRRCHEKGCRGKNDVFQATLQGDSGRGWRPAGLRPQAIGRFTQASLAGVGCQPQAGLVLGCRPPIRLPGLRIASRPQAGCPAITLRGCLGRRTKLYSSQLP
eukprot:scaffold24666_cov62-Phaeocystis_antarctica.AAC.2